MGKWKRPMRASLVRQTGRGYICAARGWAFATRSIRCLPTGLQFGRVRPRRKERFKLTLRIYPVDYSLLPPRWGPRTQWSAAVVCALSPRLASPRRRQTDCFTRSNFRCSLEWLRCSRARKLDGANRRPGSRSQRTKLAPGGEHPSRQARTAWPD